MNTAHGPPAHSSTKSGHIRTEKTGLQQYGQQAVLHYLYQSSFLVKFVLHLAAPGYLNDLGKEIGPTSMSLSKTFEQASESDY